MAEANFLPVSLVSRLPEAVKPPFDPGFLILGTGQEEAMLAMLDV
jgi:hypothetical protein